MSEEKDQIIKELRRELRRTKQQLSDTRKSKDKFKERCSGLKDELREEKKTTNQSAGS